MLTRGTLHALELFRQRGYEAIVFHAVGTGGRAMELMMKQGIIGAVFDYAMGEISDELFHGLRAGGKERLTVAGALGLPQVLCPGGSEHLGILVSTPHQLPDRWKDHAHVWHNEVVLAPRLNVKELKMVAREVGKRLQSTRGNAVLMIPTLGTGSYAMPGGPMNDPKGDKAYFAALKAAVPSTIEIVERDLHAEDPAFVAEAVDRLIALIEGGAGQGRLSDGAPKRDEGGRRPARQARVSVLGTLPFEIRNAQGERIDHAFHAGRGASLRRPRRRREGPRRALPLGERSLPAHERFLPNSVVVIGHGVTSHWDRPWQTELSEALGAAGLASRADLVRGERRVRGPLRGRDAHEGSG